MCDVGGHVTLHGGIFIQRDKLDASFEGNFRDISRKTTATSAALDAAMAFRETRGVHTTKVRTTGV